MSELVVDLSLDKVADEVAFGGLGVRRVRRKESVAAGFLEKGQWLNVSSILELQPLQLKLSVVIVANDNEQQRALLQAAVDGTKVARSVDACAKFPSADPVTRSVRAANPDVI